MKKKTISANKESPLRIVIIGANFAGLTTANHLSRNFSVTVIDSRQQFEFLPNIHELLSGVKKPGSLRIDRKRLIGRAGHRFIKDTVTTIDPAKRKIYTSGRKRMPYDICVVAVGGVNNTSGIAGTAKFSLPFKSVEDCQNIELLSAGDELNDFDPASKPTVVSFGDLQTYVIMGNIAVAGPLFAGAKEGIFQATMTKLDPPKGLSSAIDLYNRYSPRFIASLISDLEGTLSE